MLDNNECPICHSYAREKDIRKELVLTDISKNFKAIKAFANDKQKRDLRKLNTVDDIPTNLKQNKIQHIVSQKENRSQVNEIKESKNEIKPTDLVNSLTENSKN